MSDPRTAAPGPADLDADFDEERDEPVESLLPRGTDRRWWWISAAILVPVLAVLVWLGTANARDVITPRTIGYQVVDASTVIVDAEIERPSGMPVTCEVQAMDVRHGTVGSVPLVLGAEGGSVVRRKVTVRTTAEAVTGVVKSCRKQ